MKNHLKIESVSVLNNLKEYFSQPGISFIGYVVSSWHLDVLYSYLIQNKGNINGKGIIIIAKQGNILNSTFRINNNDLFNVEGIDVTYIYLDNPVSQESAKSYISYLFKAFLQIIKLKKKKKTIRLLTPGGIDLNLLFGFFNPLQFNVKYISIDEGTASYIKESDHYFVTNKFKDNFSSGFFEKLRVKLKYQFKKCIINTIRLFGAINTEKYYFFHKKGKHLIPEPTICKALSNYYFGKKTEIQPFQKTGQILLLKDFDEKMIPENDVFELYKNIINRIQQTGLTIYIKKHPNDNNTDFDDLIMTNFSNCEILKGNYNAENLSSVLCPKILIGGISTSLFTLPFIFETKSYNFIKMYFRYSLDKEYEKRIKLFLQYFSNTKNITFINDFEELPTITDGP